MALGSQDETSCVDVHMLDGHERALSAGYGLVLEHAHGSHDDNLLTCSFYGK